MPAIWALRPQLCAAPVCGAGKSRVSRIVSGESFKDANSDASARTIAIDKVAPDPTQPRKYFAPDALAELGQSIKELGLLQPIAVRRNDIGEGYVIVAGARRTAPAY